MTTSTTTKKKNKTLSEDKGSGVSLMEDTHFAGEPLQLEAKESGGKKKWILKGEFGRVDKATENKRLYPKEVIEGQIKKLGEGFEKRRVYGHCDHPSDGRTSLNHASHIITKLEVQPNGSVYGEAEILPTQSGNNLKALAEAGCGIGFSSRGFGTTKANQQGEDVVQEDYRLVTYDAVADPASKDAWPEAVQEAKKLPVDAALSEEVLADAEGMRALQDKLAKTEAQLAATEGRLDEAASKIVTSIKESKATLEANIKARLLADPSVAGSLTALEAVIRAVRPYLPENAEGDFMSDKDNEIAELRKQIEALTAAKDESEANLLKMSAMAKTAGYAYFLEKCVAGSADADLIRQVVGDVSSYNSSDEIASKVEGVKAELARRAAERAVQEQKESARVKELETKIGGLTEALEKSVALNKQQAIDGYIAERVKFHPKREAIIEFFTKTPPVNRSQVDEALEQFRVPMSESDQAEDIRSRVRRLLNTQGVESLPEATKPSPQLALVEGQQAKNYNGTGMSFEDITKLSGISN